MSKYHFDISYELKKWPETGEKFRCLGTQVLGDLALLPFIT